MSKGIICIFFCFGYQAAEPTPPVDTFCSNYEQVVKTPGDVQAIQSLPSQVRKRIQGNDLDYLCSCRGWEDVACQSRSTPK